MTSEGKTALKRARWFIIIWAGGAVTVLLALVLLGHAISG